MECHGALQLLFLGTTYLEVEIGENVDQVVKEVHSQYNLKYRPEQIYKGFPLSKCITNICKIQFLASVVTAAAFPIVPVCTWGEWTETSCSVTCGNGRYERHRSREGAGCSGEQRITRSCFSPCAPAGKF